MMEGTARILVVDDEQSMREFLEIFLRREGYDVVTAGDVDTAVAHLEADEIDLVITDMQMPEKTGLDLLLAAREISPETILIVVTAFGTTDSAIASNHRFVRESDSPFDQIFELPDISGEGIAREHLVGRSVQSLDVLSEFLCEYPDEVLSE